MTESCKKRCVPGRGQSGCAFRGAKMALQPITDAAHLVHGPASCEMGSWDFRPTLSSAATIHRHSLTTDLGETEVIHGGERKLAAAIGEAIAATDPAAVFVYQTCLPAMIGDDIRAVCRAAAARWGRPVVPVDVPGFAGSRPFGNHQAAQALIDHVIGTAEPEILTGSEINLIGEFNLAGEMGRLRPLLSALGIRVLASLSGDGRYADIACAHRARASVLLCSQGMAHLAEELDRRYGIPFIDGNFHGAANCADTLTRLADLLVRRGGPADLPQRTERLIRREQSRVEGRLAGYRRSLAGKRVLLACGGAKTWSLISILQAAGMEVVGTALHKASPADRGKAARCLGAAAEPAADVSPHADIVLSGGTGQYELMKQGTAWLEVNHQRDFALSGFDGGLVLLDRIQRALGSPVWRQLEAPPPWEAAPDSNVVALPGRRPARHRTAAPGLCRSGGGRTP